MKMDQNSWIPERTSAKWRITKNAEFVALINGFPCKSENFNEEKVGIPLIRIRDITSGKTSTYYSGEYPSDLVVDDGDLLVGMDGEFNSRIWRGGKALLNQRCCKLTCNDDLVKRYISYILPFQLKVIGALKNSTTVKHLNNHDILNAKFPIPRNRNDLEKIVYSIDRATNGLSLVTNNLEKECDLLSEYRESLITRVVTKGLDPTVPMKDSGIDWIGSIPDAWQTNKISRICSTQSGGTPSSNNDNFYVNGTHPWIRTTDLNNSELFDAPMKITDQAIQDSACKYVPKNSVLIAMYGGKGTVGKHALLRFSSTINQAVCAVTPNDTLTPEYLYFLAKVYRPLWMTDALSTRKDPNISQADIKNWRIPVPPIDEQRKIVEYCFNIQRKIDLLNEKNSLIIERLFEYRNSLISSVMASLAKS